MTKSDGPRARHRHRSELLPLAGGFQFLAGVLRAGQWFRAVSPAVIQGLLAGIGILILAAQFHVMVDDKPPGTGKEFGGILNLATLPQAVWKGLSETDHRPAAMLGVITILAIVLWTVFVPKKLKFLPAPLVGVVVATIAAALFQADANFISVPNNLLEAMQFPTLGDPGSVFAGPSLIEAVGPILLAGLAQAFVASAESLLTATAVDSMQQHAPRTNYDRELMAQGTGNLLCGLVGALPMTGVIVRSSANVLAGARTRTSTILHGAWLLVFAVLLSRDDCNTTTASVQCINKINTIQERHQVMDSDRSKPLVGVIMGSKSDRETLRHAAEVLAEFGVPAERKRKG